MDFFADESTGKLLPPEFIGFGITKDSFEKWTPIDSISLIYFQSLLMTSQSGYFDLLRESFSAKHEDLA